MFPAVVEEGVWVSRTHRPGSAVSWKWMGVPHSASEEDWRDSMTHTRRKSLPMLSSGPTGRREPLQMEDSNMEHGAESVEPGMPESPGHLSGRRKNYPLRKRPLVPEKPKACKVLLTRLENVAGPRSADEADELPPDLPKPPSPAPSSEDTGLAQPRKRRLASLNAEALNNLLLEREDTSSVAGTRRSRGGDPHRSRDRDRATGSWSSSKKRPRLGDLGEGSRDLSPEPAPDESARRDGDPAPKRLASLNAAAFLKLSQERELPLRPPRAHAEADGRSAEPPAPKVLRPKWAKVNGKNYPKTRQGAGSGEAAGWQGHPNEPRPSATPQGPSIQPSYQPPSKALESPLGLRPHLPLLMGGQAALKPEPGRPGEESPAPKQELHQPSFPAPQLSPLPMPGNPADYSGLCGGPELTALGSFYLYCGQDGLQCGSYSPCPMLPEGKLSPVAVPKEGLLLAPSSVPSGSPFQHPSWSSSPYCSSEDTGVNGYSICGVLPLSLTHVGTTCGGCPYKMPFAAGELMMSLLWYYRPEHLQGGRSPSMHEPLQNEVFASRHQDQNSVACIEEKCYVLTFAEYCRFCAMAKRRGEGLPSRKTALVPPSADYSTPPHRTVPEDTDPELVFLCRHVYDFRHGRILKNPQ
ncbi:bromo adjacent homology domain-containing 1 protein isoform X5 [Octodon degus]|uniref:Bromo adjacent homology domain-containing 1 protein isoform X5 n=1 Tax=Octodon degus TaxID=10160 RepID=A0A6P6E600_OCTDE|nr:bromo adjacent homology domain-containing 1 protein isoform X5 [Octodon degus]